MCGLYSAFHVTPIEVFKKLEQLRHRGFDSQGISGFGKNTYYQWLCLRKDVTKWDVDNKFDGNALLGHTRWASVGQVSIENTHPILSYNQNVLLVHNGTIENSSKLRGLVNTKPRGETDTEAVCDWIDLVFEDWHSAISSNLVIIQNYLQGTWAINFLHKDYPNHIFFLVKDSPLYFDRNMFCSEAEYFDKYYKIPNNSWGWLERIQEYNDKSYYKLNLNGQYITPTYIKNNMETVSNATQLGSLDPMLKEIRAQAEFAPNLEMNAEIFKNWWKLNCDGIPHYKSVTLIGMGSSYNAALLGRKYFRDVGIPCSVEYASEYHFTGDEQYDSVFRLAISQSGETADVKAVMQKLPIHASLLTNHMLGSCGEYALQCFPLGLPREAALAATGTFSATCLTLWAMANHETPERILECLNVFRTGVQEILKQEEQIKAIASSLSIQQHAFVLGHDMQYPVAREGALKLKEIGRIFAEASPIGEHRHGSIVLQNGKMCNFVLLGLPTCPKYQISLGNCEQIKARYGRLIGVGVIREKIFDDFVEVPHAGQDIHPLLCNVVMQLISYYIAKHKGLGTTYVANLAKTVTVL